MKSKFLTLSHEEAQRLREIISGDQCGSNRVACQAAFKKLDDFVCAVWDEEEEAEQAGRKHSP
jgi:hypothetical protein